jgi:hypothetical protein
VLDRFHIAAAADDQAILELEERDAAHVEGLAVGTVAPPVPLSSVQQVWPSSAERIRSARKSGSPRTSRPSSPGPVRWSRTPARGGREFAVVVAVKQLDDGSRSWAFIASTSWLTTWGHPESS